MTDYDEFVKKTYPEKWIFKEKNSSSLLKVKWGPEKM